ncbi:hypothetical protein PMIN01_01001 [Paraphaeosphaeria minitans]|uniref:Alpha-ketoglutarate-dependent sulfonate dioxygenase n=1 Tax=Paraphaeosphaeria minitans TaxID=565426 RepID=A0A9P6GTB4_9PLEO|nr:hypothetical protein PMIN01_01001 [Paraphaeosphaeria minitans]
MPPTRENDVAPPPYSSHPAPTPAADTHVGIGCEWGDAINAELPTATQCATHLKLLHSLARLRKEVGCCEGLYGISFEGGTVGGAAEAGTLAERVREKRWSVFVARAVDRFERWWERLLEGCGAWNAKLQTSYFDGARSGEAKEVARWPSEGIGMDAFLYKCMPPLDVLMVWHTYMLNPRAYLEDCMRFGKRTQWRSSFPWQLIEESIDESFAYDPPAESKETFARLTPDAPWDWEHDMCDKSVACPRCCNELLVPYTRTPTKYSADDISVYLAEYFGYASNSFYEVCSRCDLVVTHEKLRVGKFVDDVTELRTHNLPLYGTVLGAKGIPEVTAKGRKLGSHDPFFPNRLCERLQRFEPQSLRKDMEHLTIDSVKRDFEKIMRKREIVCYVNSDQYNKFHLARDSKIAVRKMLSHYWDNSSPPSLTATMHRSVLKYHRFKNLIAISTNMAVPTLDIDLAWHTHQLTPKTYYRYTLSETKRFVNHDDKVPGPDLSTAFVRTAQLYEKKYAEPYAECACWYCEVTREERRAALSSRVFGFPLDVERTAAMELPTHAAAGPHISTHNALVPASTTATAPQRRAERDRLDRAYAGVRARYAKKKRVPPERETHTVVYGPYGYPVVLPGYVPYYAESTAASQASLKHRDVSSHYRRVSKAACPHVQAKLLHGAVCVLALCAVQEGVAKQSECAELGAGSWDRELVGLRSCAAAQHVAVNGMITYVCDGG